MSQVKTLSARERIEGLLDAGSFIEIGASVHARNTDFNMPEKQTPADGVITGYGTIDSNLVYVFSQDASVMGGKGRHGISRVRPEQPTHSALPAHTLRAARSCTPVPFRH